jgi:octanoyl-[GcvH]:protein N-octanoyltransferase
MSLLKNRPQWRFINQSTSILQQSPLFSFATDDTLCEEVGQLRSKPVIRAWVHEASVVLGIQDHRLPYLPDGMKGLIEQGYTPIVRNSGGLAVVLDPGILNLSLILSEQQEKMSIDAGYELMLELVKALFPEASSKIEAYEIVGSYCPGTYDLSINGQKFAGISQRRMRQGIAVQIYLCIEGSGANRAMLIRDFYETALKGEETKFVYPNVNPDVLASLSELLDTNLTVQKVIQRLQHYFSTNVDLDEQQSLFSSELAKFEFYYARIIERNMKMLNEV